MEDIGGNGKRKKMMVMMTGRSEDEDADLDTCHPGPCHEFFFSLFRPLFACARISVRAGAPPACLGRPFGGAILPQIAPGENSKIIWIRKEEKKFNFFFQWVSISVVFSFFSISLLNSSSLFFFTMMDLSSCFANSN